jgi:hypothetical protein
MHSRLYSCLLFTPAVGLWVASLLQPALKQQGGGSFRYSGMYCLMIGWIGVFGRPQWILPWSANVLFWMATLSGVCQRQPGQRALALSLAAIPLALVALANRTIEMNEGGDRTAVVPGLGFYLWLASIAASAAALFLKTLFLKTQDSL